MPAIARKPRFDDITPDILTKRCADPPMPHELRFAWAERMRQYEAAQSEAPAEKDEETQP